MAKQQSDIFSEQSEDRYRVLLESINGVVWEANALTMQFTFVSESAREILGYAPECWLNDPNFWLSKIYHEDKAAIENYYIISQPINNHTFEFRMLKSDGSIIWLRNTVSLHRKNGETPSYCGILLDITATKLLSDLEQLEKNVLAMNAEPHTPLVDILEYYTRGIERLFPNTKCSIIRISDNRIYNWASPSLPLEYVNAIHGLAIGPSVGSCGTAAYSKTRVISADIANDTKWNGYQELALKHGLRACWSNPIIDSDGNVLATFANYYATVKQPEEWELSIIDRSSSILRVILENRKYANTILEMNVLASQGQELANFGTWQLDLTNNKIQWSDVLYKIYGIDKSYVMNCFDDYLVLVHPDYREQTKRATYQLLEDHKDITLNERILRPDGSVRELKSWLRVITNDNHEPIKIVGACLDITEQIRTKKKMKEIAWLQSHVVRAPLARIMGLVQLLKEGVTPEEAQQIDFYQSILDAANELDKVIHDINDNT